MTVSNSYHVLITPPLCHQACAALASVIGWRVRE